RGDLNRPYTVSNVTIQSTRPLHINRLFIAKTPQQVLTLLPLLFNVCGIAQAYAAFSALNQALNIEINNTANIARQLLLTVELIREHCWWLLINRDKTKLTPFIALVSQFKQALFINGDVFSLNSQLQVNHRQLAVLIKQLELELNPLFNQQRLEFLAINTESELTQWLASNNSLIAIVLNKLAGNEYLGKSDIELLPVLDNIILNDYLLQQNAHEFSYYPNWQNKPYETTCVNRQKNQPLIVQLLNKYGNSIFTRLISRFIELAQAIELLKQYSIELTQTSNHYHGAIIANTGLAQVQASRGLLIHRVKLIEGVISHYQIIAPTEWNFHPQGVVAQSLKQLTAPNKNLLQQQAALIINAIDPCVAFELNID
ncbi:MAG: nickel-dependent hydrogenase large subunit, partial [Methylococcaceae bacterium]